MEGVGLDLADSPAGSPDAPGSSDAIVSSDMSLTLPLNGVRPLVERRPLERTVLEALSCRRLASKPFLMPVVVERMRANLGRNELSDDPRYWPYDRAELQRLLREIRFLDRVDQRPPMKQPTAVFFHPNKLPLLIAELTRQRAGIFDRLRRMGRGTFEFFSTDSEPFFEEGASQGGTEEFTFEINQFARLGLGEDPREDAIGRVLTEKKPSEFFFRRTLADVGVSPGRSEGRQRKGRAADARHTRSVLQVFRGGPPYNDGATGC